MSAAHVRTNVMFPAEVIGELRELVPARERSAFVAEATRRGLLVLKQKQALKQTAGAWSDELHADLTTDGDMSRYRSERNAEWEAPRTRVAEDSAEYHVPSGQ